MSLKKMTKDELELLSNKRSTFKWIHVFCLRNLFEIANWLSIILNVAFGTKSSILLSIEKYKIFLDITIESAVIFLALSIVYNSSIKSKLYMYNFISQFPLLYILL